MGEDRLQDGSKKKAKEEKKMVMTTGVLAMIKGRLTRGLLTTFQGVASGEEQVSWSILPQRHGYLAVPSRTVLARYIYSVLRNGHGVCGGDGRISLPISETSLLIELDITNAPPAGVSLCHSATWSVAQVPLLLWRRGWAGRISARQRKNLSRRTALQRWPANRSRLPFRCCNVAPIRKFKCRQSSYSSFGLLVKQGRIFHWESPFASPRAADAPSQAATKL